MRLPHLRSPGSQEAEPDRLHSSLGSQVPVPSQAPHRHHSHSASCIPGVSGHPCLSPPTQSPWICHPLGRRVSGSVEPYPWGQAQPDRQGPRAGMLRFNSCCSHVLSLLSSGSRCSSLQFTKTWPAGQAAARRKGREKAVLQPLAWAGGTVWVPGRGRQLCGFAHHRDEAGRCCHRTRQHPQQHPLPNKTSVPAAPPCTPPKIYLHFLLQELCISSLT